MSKKKKILFREIVQAIDVQSLVDRIFLCFKSKSQSEIEEIIGLAKGTCWQWKAKKQSPTLAQVAKIAAFTGVSWDYLLTGKQTAPLPDAGAEQTKITPLTADQQAAISGITEEIFEHLKSIEFLRSGLEIVRHNPESARRMLADQNSSISQSLLKVIPPKTA